MSSAQRQPDTMRQQTMTENEQKQETPNQDDSNYRYENY